MRRTLRAPRLAAIIAGAVVLTATLVAAAPAPSAVAAVVADVQQPDFTPSSNPFRRYALNVTGRVLGGAMPNKWRAEQIANMHQYNYDWRSLNAQFGQNPANPNYVGSPDSYQDYLLRKAELDQFGGKDGKTMSVPATGTSKMGKVIGGAGNAVTTLTGMAFGIQIGSGALQLLGVDNSGMVCGNVGDDLGGNLAALLSGVDCDAWRLENTYVPNSDVVPGYVQSEICNAANTECYTLHSVVDYSNFRYVCFTDSKGSSTPALHVWRNGRSTSLAHDLDASPYWNHAACGGFGSGRATFTIGYTADAPTLTAWRIASSSNPIGPVTTASADPDRFLECSVVGSDGNTYTKASATYRETGGEIAPPECPTLPPGVTAASAAINEKGNGGKTTELWSENTTPEYLDWWNSYPECRTGACQLDLVNKADPARAFSCFDNATACADWFAQPNKADLYECRYGINVVDLAECYVYSGVFKPERVAVGAPYSDPMTGEWSGGVSGPKPDGTAMGTAVQNPAVARSCQGTTITGFDPIGFVMRPVQCALEWAFVPRVAVVEAELEKGDQAWSTKPPAVLAGMVEDWDVDAEVGGCSRSVTLFGVTFDVWNFCPGAELEWVGTLSKTLIGAGLTVAVIASIRRSVGGAVDYRG